MRVEVLRYGTGPGSRRRKRPEHKRRPLLQCAAPLEQRPQRPLRNRRWQAAQAKARTMMIARARARARARAEADWGRDPSPQVPWHQLRGPAPGRDPVPLQLLLLCPAQEKGRRRTLGMAGHPRQAVH